MGDGKKTSAAADGEAEYEYEYDEFGDDAAADAYAERQFDEDLEGEDIEEFPTETEYRYAESEIDHALKDDADFDLHLSDEQIGFTVFEGPVEDGIIWDTFEDGTAF